MRGFTWARLAGTGVDARIHLGALGRGGGECANSPGAYLAPDRPAGCWPGDRRAPRIRPVGGLPVLWPFVTVEPGGGSYPQRRFQIPPDGVELLLVRHGQSEAYVDGQIFPLVDGHGDPPLSARGQVQATLVGARLAAEGVDAIYVTTLRRTAETAAPLAERCGLPVRVEPSLREVFLGEWEGGLYRKMVADGHPLALRVFAEERWDVIPGGESPESITARVRSGIAKIVAAHPGERVAIFTHGGVIGQAIAVASGSRPFAFTSADNASISRIAVFDGRWMVRAFNDTAHLDDPGPRVN